MVENGTENSQNHTCIDIEGDVIGSRRPGSTGASSKPPRCIFKVPQVLRRQNKEAYAPDVVSIGPYHSSEERKRFQLMKKVKQGYLEELLLRMDSMSFETLVERIVNFSEQKKGDESQSSFIGPELRGLQMHRKDGRIEFDKQAREFYAEPLEHLSPKDFIEMMVVDACFLVQLFRKRLSVQLGDIDDPDVVIDPVFDMACMFQYVCHDILLLENQLPWFVLQRFYSVMLEKCPGVPSLPILILTAFSSLPPLAHNCKSYKKKLSDPKNPNENGDDKTLHILDLIRTSIVFPLFRHESARFNSKTQFMHPATALSETGIKFACPIESDSIMEIGFAKRVFTIPHLEIGELTESLFRNLIALEQCYHGHSQQITSYAVVMDNLIASSKDMKLLCERKVLGNWLSAEDGSKFFNNLYNGTSTDKFYYGELCTAVNQHYESQWKRSVEELITEKFSSPWKLISFCFAIILLALTLWQTVYNIQDHM
ncbi:hypothetical protein GBA52_004080 [Prunus armeniaca]|nr:hypothetical protein GBA52_004080 [Prunus armeniaca]